MSANTSNANTNGTKLMQTRQDSFVRSGNDMTTDNSSKVDEVVAKFRDSVIDELVTMRCDIDVLRQGGWAASVKVGGFVETNPITYAQRDRIREQISERLSQVTALTGNGRSIEDSNNEVKQHEAISEGMLTSPASQVSTTPEEWKPAGIRNIAPLVCPSMPKLSDMVSFSWDFLKAEFVGAIEHSPGLWYVPLKAGGTRLPPGRCFYIISATNEPYLPREPTQHGAKITGFFNEDETEDGKVIDYDGVPLFISAATLGRKTFPENRFIYFGMYSQPRWSDRLSYDDLVDHVPHHVKQYWAEQLADPARPEWVTKALGKHFFNKPEYLGPIPDSTPNGSALEEVDEVEKKELRKAVKDYIEDLRAWANEARSYVNLFKPETLMTAYEASDFDANPGLRLHWEYLECKKWDEGFYEMLVRDQRYYSSKR